jgi:AraC family transcriptional regulator
MSTSSFPANASLVVSFAKPTARRGGLPTPQERYLFEAGRNGRTGREPPVPAVEISPSHLIERRSVTHGGLTAEIVKAKVLDKIEFRFQAQVHLLIVCIQGARRDGETSVEGLPRSTLRDLTGKLTFVPAGHEYHEWHDPRVLTRLIFCYFDADRLPIQNELPSRERREMQLAPRLFVEDQELLCTARKLQRLIEDPASSNQLHLEALGVVLAHELMRVHDGAPSPASPIRGGLAAWQQRLVTNYIDEHFAQRIPLAALASLARLSPHYFCRAFKQSFGVPPHHYHRNRRIEQAKILLARATGSVTEIGLTLGFSTTSSFTAAFRKAMGRTPTEYRRSLACGGLNAQDHGRPRTR